MHNVVRYRVMLDPGHGGKDVGASNKHTTEKEINLVVARACKDFLKDYPDVEVEMTRYQDTNVDLHTRGTISNLYQANLFLSIHHNAGGGDGYEVYHYTGSVQGKVFAELIAEEFEIIGQNRRYVGSGLYAGTQPGDYTVLHITDAISALGEFGFVDTKDYTQFDSRMELKAIGQAYGKAILRYFNIELKEEEVEIPETQTLEKRVNHIERQMERLYRLVNQIKEENDNGKINS